jgi:hypothetical protein
MWFEAIEIRFAAQHRLHLTAFGVGMWRPFGRKSDFTLSCPAKIGGR